MNNLSPSFPLILVTRSLVRYPGYYIVLNSGGSRKKNDLGTKNLNKNIIKFNSNFSNNIML